MKKADVLYIHRNGGMYMSILESNDLCKVYGSGEKFASVAFPLLIFE